MVYAFHKRGNSEKRLYSTGRPPNDMPPEVEKYIKENLEEDAFLSSRKRCERIREKFGYVLTHARLQRAYKRFGITFSRLKTVMKSAYARQPQLDRERIEFAEKLASLL